MLLIIDNQSKFIKQFKREYLSEQDFECVFFDHNQPLNIPINNKISGIILSGGKGSPYQPLNLTSNFVALINYDVPILGLCLGYEIIAVAYQGRIRRMDAQVNRREKITLTDMSDPLFDGINSNEIFLREKHSFMVSYLPPAFDILGHSENCPYEIIKLKNRPVYGFQSHPESSGAMGMKIMKNFFKMCKLIN